VAAALLATMKLRRETRAGEFVVFLVFIGSEFFVFGVVDPTKPFISSSEFGLYLPN